MGPWVNLALVLIGGLLWAGALFVARSRRAREGLAMAGFTAFGLLVASAVASGGFDL